MSKRRLVDLFAGVGGMSLGFEMAAFETVLANEIDNSIASAFKQNRPSVEMITEDITKLDLENVFRPLRGAIDGVVGGPPCQGFSQKGKRRSILDDRNFLFKSFFRVVDIIRPKFFVMENVPSLLTTEGGYFAQEIRELFEGIGFAITMQVVSASELAVPQNRRRAVITGIRGTQARKPILTLPGLGKCTVWDAISDLAFLDSGAGHFKQPYKLAAQTVYQKEARRDSDVLFNHVATTHSPIAIERMSLVPPGGGRSSLPDHHLTKSIFSGTWGRMIESEPSVTITTRFDTPSSGKFTHPHLNRAITVREAARLQSFPDTFVFHGTKTSQMKQVGNAVPPAMAREIAVAIEKEL